jgi:glycosyl transferase family 25
MDIRTIKSYIINLEKYKKKYERTKKNLSRFNITPERFDAIYIDDVNSQDIKNITYPSVQYTIERGRNVDNNIGSKGAIGCYLSHTKLWKMLLESNEDMFLIFEDDVNINNYTIEQLNQTLQEVGNYDWDFIFLGYSKPYLMNDIKIDNVYKINSITYGMHAYLINKKGALKLLKHSFPIVDQIDSYLSYMASRGDINAYRLKENYFIQDNIEGTSIQTDFSIKPLLTRLSNKQLIFLCILFIFLAVIIFIQLVNYFKSLIIK